jgi:ubiquinone/menaquinone biosynthesis C-methylase UbiE
MNKPLPEFRLNSPQGKSILALARGADFAHPGEDRVIESVASGLLPNKSLRLLDVGCGRGGTAQWFYEHNFGQVTGIDLDKTSIEYARNKYPHVDFRHADVSHLPSFQGDFFDIIYSFNAFYAFTDQLLALHEIRSVAKPGAKLLIYDYTKPLGGRLPEALGSEIGQPIVKENIKIWLEASRWKLESIHDFTNLYSESYIQLLQKFELKRDEILKSSDQEWYDFITRWYGALQLALSQGILGGALISAIAVE